MVDSYKWLPPSLKGYFEKMRIEPPVDIPWTPLAKPLSDTIRTSNSAPGSTKPMSVLTAPVTSNPPAVTRV